MISLAHFRLLRARRGRTDLRGAARTFAHYWLYPGYFTRLVQSCQDEVELELQAVELLALNRRCAQVWTAAEQADLVAMREQLRDPIELAQRIAERAALAGLPVETAFWDPILRDQLRAAPELLDPVRRFLIRLFEAPADRRLSLLDQLAALEVGLN